MRATETTAPLARAPFPTTPAEIRALLPSGLDRVAGFVALVAVSVAVGAAAAGTDDVVAFIGDHVEVAFAAAALVWVAIVARGPVACLAGVAAAATAGGHVVIASVGGADLMIGDLFFLPLVAWAVWLAVTRPRARAEREPRVALGQGAVVAFLAIGALSLLQVAASDPGRLQVSAISFGRFCQTVLLAWLAATVIRTPRQLALVLGAAALGATVSIGAALVEGVQDAGALATARFEGFLGPNGIGLVGGFLLILGVFGAFGDDRRQRIALAVAGVAGLLLGKSVGAFVATGIALAAGVALGQATSSRQRGLSTFVAFAVALVAVVGVVQTLRPAATPGTPEFRDSSTAQRVIVGAAAIEMFERHPVFGVGWRRSDSAAVSSDRDIAFELRARFQGARHDFFPDVAPTSVHNSYLQILAELGLVGFVAFAFLIAAVGVGAVEIVRSLPRGDPLWAPARALTLGLLLTVIWLNDNPLYGGQVETVLLAISVGCLGAIARMRRARPAAGTA